MPRRDHERIPTDSPIGHIWARLGVLSSFHGAMRFLEAQAETQGTSLDVKTVEAKARGMAFTIRTARDFFQASPSAELSTTAVCYYYGTLNLLEALLISRVDNDVTLDEVEAFTLAGHGLGTFSDCSHEFPASEKVLILGKRGFTPEFLARMGYDRQRFGASKRFRSGKDFEERASDQDRDRVASVKDLLARIPELKSVYCELFREQPRYLHFRLAPQVRVTGAGVSFIDSLYAAGMQVPYYSNSPYLSAEDIGSVLDFVPGLSPDRLREYDVDGERGLELVDQIRDRSVLRSIHSAVERRTYRSVMCFDACVQPLLGIEDPILLDFVMLYCLSIWSRYRPALWREIIDGRLDSFGPLFRTFLMVVQRVVPNAILNRIYGRDFLFAGFPYLA